MNDAHNALDVNNGQQACRRYNIHNVADPRHPHCTIYILLPIPVPRSILFLSRCSTFPRRLVRASLSSSSFRAHVCISLLLLFRKRNIRGRNRKRHGRVSNRYSVAVSHTASRDTTVDARTL